MLYNSKYFQVRLHPRHVQATRTSARFESLETMQEEQDSVLAVLKQQSHLGLVVDVRLAPGRNDKAFEQALSHWRSSISEMFPRVAILVQTAVGKMQARRLAVSDGAQNTRPFNNEKAALEYAADGLGE